MKTTFSILFTLLLTAAVPAQEETRAPRQERDPGTREARIEQMRQRLRERLQRFDEALPRREAVEEGERATPEQPARRPRRPDRDGDEARSPAPPWAPQGRGADEPPAGPRPGMRRGERRFPGWERSEAPEDRAGQRAEADRGWQQFRRPGGADRQPMPRAMRPMLPPQGLGWQQGFERQQGFEPPHGFGPERFQPRAPEAGRMRRGQDPGFEAPGFGRSQFRQFPAPVERPLLRRMMARRLQLQWSEGRAPREGQGFSPDCSGGRRSARRAGRQEG